MAWECNSSMPPMGSSLTLAIWRSSAALELFGGTERLTRELDLAMLETCSSARRAEYTCSKSQEPDRLKVEIVNRQMSGGET